MQTTSQQRFKETPSCHEWLFVTILFAVLACAFVLVTSYSSSFLYYHPDLYDSAIYQVIGQRWMKGDFPYVDYWDMKGPYVLAINALGYALCDSPRGVMMVQIVFMLISFLLLWRFLRDYLSIKYAVVGIACIVVMLMQMECDNNAGIYVLPFFVVAFHRLYKWVNDTNKQSGKKHPPLMAMFYGFCLALCFLNRLTDAAGIGLGVLYVVMVLIARRQWINLLLNGLCFICGFMLLLVPVWMYFQAHGAVDEWLDATVVTAFEYGVNNKPIVAMDLHGLFAFLKAFFPCYSLVIVALFVFFNNPSRRLQSAIWLLVAGGQMIWFLNSNRYAHYAIVTIPYLCIILAELKQSSFCHLKRWMRKAIVFVSIAFFLVCFFHESLQAYHDMNHESPLYGIYENLMRGIPEDERHQVEIYNGASSFHFYFNNQPPCKYFVMNDLTFGRTPSLGPKMREDLENKQPTWLIVEGRRTFIDDILSRKYVVQKSMNHHQYTLYRLKSLKN